MEIIFAPQPEISLDWTQLVNRVAMPTGAKRGFNGEREARRISLERQQRATRKRKELMTQSVNRPLADAVTNSADSYGVGYLTAPFLTKRQAAQLLQCTNRYVERQVAAGRLRACKPTGKFVRIRRQDLDTFLMSGASIAA